MKPQSVIKPQSVCVIFQSSINSPLHILQAFDKRQASEKPVHARSACVKHESKLPI